MKTRVDLELGTARGWRSIPLLAWLALGLTWLVPSQDLGAAASSPAAASARVTFTKITTGPLVTDRGSGYMASDADYDKDGYLDLFVGRYNIGRTTLYHNQGDGTFTGVTNSVFPLPTGVVGACAWADYDNDSWSDMFVFGPGSSVFYFNNGDGTFAPLTFDAMNPWNVCAVDYDNDGLLDLYVTSFITSNVNRFYRNLGRRSFRLMTAAEVGSIVEVGTFGGTSFADYDDDGDMDACVPRNTSCGLYRNDGSGRFTAVTDQSTVTTFPGSANAWGDYDNDGRLDLFVVHYNRSNAVFRNLGNGNFARADVVPFDHAYNSASLGDYDNDGFLDLFVTWGLGPNALFHNNGDGTFAMTSGVLPADPGALSYSGTWFDYDNDGALDLFVNNGDDPGQLSLVNYLYHNEGNGNAWLRVKPIGTASNRDGAGAKVRVRATYAGQTRWQRRDISAGDNYNGNNFIAHFGLGDATNVEVLRIEWPSGIVQEMQNVETNQLLKVTEPVFWMTMPSPDRVQVRSRKGEIIVVKGSSDLFDWTTLGLVTNGTGKVDFVDPEAGDLRQRFYKAERFD